MQGDRVSSYGNASHCSLSTFATNTLDFIKAALASDISFECSPSLSQEVMDALAWMESRSQEQIVCEREAMLCGLERHAEQLVKSGACSAWLNEADPYIKVISESVNGPLLEELARATLYHDVECVEFFRSGARLVGPLDVSGSGKLIDTSPHQSTDELRVGALERNRALLGSLSEDTFAEQLLELTKADARLCRMTPPVQWDRMGSLWDLAECIIAPRFGVQRGHNADGCPKIRAVDNETEAGVNQCCGVSEKLSMDGIDALVELLHSFWRSFGVLP